MIELKKNSESCSHKAELRFENWNIFVSLSVRNLVNFNFDISKHDIAQTLYVIWEIL